MFKKEYQYIVFCFINIHERKRLTSSAVNGYYKHSLYFLLKVAVSRFPTVYINKYCSINVVY